MTTLNDLALDFSIQLQHFLTSPKSVYCQNNLIQAARDLLLEAINCSSQEPDDYLTLINDAIAEHLEEIQVDEAMGKILENFNRQILRSNDDSIAQSFHVLTLAYNEHLKKKISAQSEDKILEGFFYCNDAYCIPVLEEDDEKKEDFVML